MTSKVIEGQKGNFLILDLSSYGQLLFIRKQVWNGDIKDFWCYKIFLFQATLSVETTNVCTYYIIVKIESSEGLPKILGIN